MKPSIIILGKAAKRPEGVTKDNVISAILDYLDEEYEHEMARIEQLKKDLIPM